VIGINTNENCAGSSCSGMAFPNMGGLITPWLAGNFSNFRASFP
jgi:hypothetical protein